MAGSKKIILFLTILAASLQIEGQSVTVYDLLTERYVDRPLAMHKKQLQFNSGYEFSMMKVRYDQDGEKVDLTVDGTAAAKHVIPFELKYGILDYIQLTVSTRYSNVGIRSQNLDIILAGTDYQISELNRYNGMDDLYIGTDLTVPIKWKSINWILTTGLSVPLFRHEPEKPDHYYEVIDPGLNIVALQYRYNLKTATGVPVSCFGSSLKIRTRFVSIRGTFNYSSAIKDGTSYDWKFRLVNGAFEYAKEDYKFNPGQAIDYYAEVAVQAIDWFTVEGAMAGYLQHNGWSTLTGKKVGYRDKSLTSLVVGYEILVSHYLRIEQHIAMPVAGKNLLAQLGFYTGFSLNFFAAAYE